MTIRATITRTAVLACLLLAGCVRLSAPVAGAENLYLLDAPPAVPAAETKRDLVLAVSMPEAQPGFDTAQIVYFKQPYQLDYFAGSRWADTPARMLEPLLLRALQQSAGFSMVVEAGSAIPADIRLDTELIRLQHDFSVRPSRVEIALQVRLLDLHTNRVLATRQFDGAENAATEDAYGGVVAANRLVQRILGQIAEFCLTASANR